MPPAVSEKQRRYMNLCRTHPERAYKKCPSKSVATEFSAKPPSGYATPKKRKKRDRRYD